MLVLRRRDGTGAPLYYWGEAARRADLGPDMVYCGTNVRQPFLLPPEPDAGMDFWALSLPDEDGQRATEITWRMGELPAIDWPVVRYY